MRLQRYFYLFLISLFMMTADTAMAQIQCPAPQGANPIHVENCQPGTTDWQIPFKRGAIQREIEGYSSATSVNIGETITFYVNLRDGSTRFSLDVYRMG